MARFHSQLSSTQKHLLIPPAPPVTFDAAGPGQNSNPTTGNWSHTITGNALVVVASVALANAGNSVTVKVGSTSVPQVFRYNLDLTTPILFFALLHPPLGVQTITLTVTGGGTNYWLAQSATFCNVGAFGPAQFIGANAVATGNQTVVSAPGQMIIQCFYQLSALTGPMTNYNQNAIYSPASGNMNTVIGTAIGSPKVNFSVTPLNSSANLGAAAITIRPAAQPLQVLTLPAIETLNLPMMRAGFL